MRTSESTMYKRIKYSIVSVLFGVFGLHRFMRNQYISATLYLGMLGIAVYFVGNPQNTMISAVIIMCLLVSCLADALSMLITGRFFFDEKNVSVDLRL
ncbi:MAG: NINE protein [Glaciecola sp.]|nr:NINE protein [Glaciecola sp.]MDG1816866.1 NINE protein [Glaciecola sp.]MDG2099669.1 NINE protein [Glaciecola sp.]